MFIKAGMDINFLANIAHDERAIDYLRRLGVITREGDNLDCVYIRREAGAGTSDDLALILIGKKYGISAMLGAFVMDAIDTYDKCVINPVEKGLDEALAEKIQESWEEKTGKKLVSQEEIMDIIYYSAKKNNPLVDVSSSHRRFVQFEGERTYRPTLLSHVAFIEDKRTSNFKVGFSGMESKIFYNKARKRVDYMMQQAA